MEKLSRLGHKGGGHKVHNSHAEEGARCGGVRIGSSDPGLVKNMGALPGWAAIPRIHKENPMSLGVLNNLNATYAENNLNNSSTSLSKVLSELSSGSKINSGADDAAGLSLVDGLQANQQALTQSETNATEGVGLLQVADGALSQVTSLLNRAVTLATEASNGTLNSSQDTAANQEYQSILSEITNIGTTTTYNDTAVFGTKTSIYTGDSSTTGSSINTLNIRTLSSSNVGDSDGEMAYSNGESNVFVNLSTSSKNAQATDTLNTSGTSTISVNYLVKGANDTESTATTSITVGTGTSYANTANGLISAINASGLGLTATFTTQAAAGVTGGGTETGIEITGGLVSAGVDPGSTSTSGTLNAAGISSSELLTQGQTVSITVGGVSAASVTINSSTSTLTELADAINHPVSENTQNALVTATVITNGDGTQSLSLADTSNSGGALAVTTIAANGTANSLTTGTTNSTNPTTLTVGANTTGAAGTDASVTLGLGSSGTSSSSQVLAGTIVLSNAAAGASASPITFVMGSGSASGSSAGSLTGGNTFTVNGNTLGNLATAISSELGATASVGTSGIVITSSTAGTTLEQVGNSNLTATPSLTQQSNVAGALASNGTSGSTTLTMSGDASQGFQTSDSLTVGGTIVLTNGNATTPGSAYTFTVGTSGTNSGNDYTSSTADVTGLLAAINASTTNSGISASLSGTGQIVLNATGVGTSITVGSNNTLADTSNAVTTTGVVASAPSAAFASTDTVGTGVTAINGNQITGSGDTLSGSMVIANNGTNYTFGTASSGLTANGTTVFVATGNTLSTLETAINGAKGTTDVSAALNSDGTGLNFTATTNGTSIGVTSSALSDTSTLSFTTPPNGSTDSSQNQAGVIALTDGGKLGTTLQSSAALNGTVTVSNGGVTDTFVMGASSSSVSGGTVNVVGNTLSALVSAINTEGSDTTHSGMNLHLTASQDAATGGIYLESSQTGSTTLSADTSNLTVTLGESAGTGVNGAAGQSATAAHVVYANAGTNDGSDTVTGDIVLSNTSAGGTAYGAGTVTFTMGGTASASTATHIYTGSDTTLQGLADAIKNSGLDLTASVSSSGLTVASNDQTSVMTATGTLTDSYGAVSGTPVAGASSTEATNAAATVGIKNGSVGSSDALSGSLVLTNNGVTHTFVMGSTANVNGSTITTASTSLQALATAISQDTTLGLTGSVASGALDLQATATDTTIQVGSGSTLADSVTESVSSASTGITGAASTATMTMASTLATTDIMTGSVAISANGNNGGSPITFVMGSSANSGGASGTLSGSTYTVNGNTLADLQTAVHDELGVSVGISGTNSNSLTLTSNSDNATAINITSATGSLKDAGTGATTSTSSLGSFASLSDKVQGTVSFSLEGSNTPVSFSVGGSTTVQGLINEINTGSTTSNGTTDPYGVHATATKTANGFYSVTLTSDTYGTAGDIQNTVGTSITDETGTASLSYSLTSAYNTGLSNSSVYDSSSGQTSSTLASVTANASGSNGVATISYSDGAGQSLSTTDLSNQTDAETALTDLNSAITDVAAQDGYIGAQINTLNAVSQVLTTQQENVESAQNAVQATDYASATSNMSKYEILSQTGIAALAQANSVQQEVTKLLQ
jgi:flagellin